MLTKLNPFQSSWAIITNKLTLSSACSLLARFLCKLFKSDPELCIKPNWNFKQSKCDVIYKQSELWNKRIHHPSLEPKWRTLTLDTVRGVLKSLPPWSRKPQGAGPLSVTQYIFMAWKKNKHRLYISSRCNNIVEDSGLLTRLKANIPEPHMWKEACLVCCWCLTARQLNPKTFWIEDSLNCYINCSWRQHYKTANSKIKVFFKYFLSDFNREKIFF